jgi:hypothetical protein
MVNALQEGLAHSGQLVSATVTHQAEVTTHIHPADSLPSQGEAMSSVMRLEKRDVGIPVGDDGRIGDAIDAKKVVMVRTQKPVYQEGDLIDDKPLSRASPTEDEQHEENGKWQGAKDEKVQSTQPATSSMMQLNEIDRLRLYSRQVDTPVLVLSVLLAFFVGILMATCFFLVFKDQGRSKDSAANDFTQILSGSQTANDFSQMMSSAPSMAHMPSMAHITSAPSMVGEIVANRSTMMAESMQSLLSTTFTPEAARHLSDEDKQDSDGEDDYDFETVNREFKKRHHWQWCNEEQISKMGILTQAPTKPYQKHYRTDVTPIRKAVEDLLTRNKVDFTEFNFAQDYDKLAGILHRAEGYFMSADENQGQILFMVETVRLRIKVGDLILIQKSGSTILGANTGLPGIPKAGNESPAGAAERMWREWFHLPQNSAVFVEDKAETNEIPKGMRGLRCVENAFLIDVQVTTEDPAVLKKLGLPDFSAFETSAQEDDTGPSEDAKFEWMTQGQCRSNGIEINGYDTLSDILDSRRSSGLNEGDEASRISKLKNFLTEAGINLELWTDQSSGTRLQSLLSEMTSGRCYITKTGSGMPQRCVNVVALRLMSPDRHFMLVDKLRTHTTTGAEERSPQLPGSKKKHQESLESSALRILSDQLHLTAEDVVIANNASTWEYFEYTEPSQRYNGLLTKYQKYFVDITLDDNAQLLKQVCLEEKMLHGGFQNFAF